MPWSSSFDASHNVIELVYFGSVSSKELIEAVDAAIEISKKKNTKLVLADCIKMTGGHSLLDLWALVNIYFTRDLRGLKEAIVLPSLKSSGQFVRFYETASLNRGLNVKVFSDIAEAREWLVD